MESKSAHDDTKNSHIDVNASQMDRLLQIMVMLRDREYGCPWDLEQSIQSLAPFTIEEVYEVVDAIERQDMVDLEDELGDLLFQVVFYAQLSQEEGGFNFDDVAKAVSDKLVRRHPHVFPDGKMEQFGNKQALSAAEVVVNWESIKEQERAEKKAKRGGGSEPEQLSLLNDVPKALPALERAKKLQKRAASVGFDWEDPGPVLAKLKEEVSELEAALAGKDCNEIHGEFGDVLFSLVNLGRHIGEEPEIALRSANAKFEKRFRWIELSLDGRGKNIQNTPLAEMEQLWNQAKLQDL